MKVTEIQNPHDAFFKTLLGRVPLARDFMRHYLPPDVAVALDLRTVEVMKESFIDEDLRDYFSDLLYRVRLKSGRTAYVYVLLEHKSAPDRWTPLQVLGYEVQFWQDRKREGADRLPLIIPVVLYHGARRWNIGARFSDLVEEIEPASWRRFLPDFEHHLCDLTKLADAQLKGSPGLRIALLVMKYIFSDRLDERLDEIVELLRQLPEDAVRGYLIPLIAYVVRATRKVSAERMGQKLRHSLAKQTEEVMHTLVDDWLKEGLQKGLEQGKSEGMEIGRAIAAVEMTQNQLTRKLGELSERTRRRVRKLSYEQLMQLSLDLLDFTKPADLNLWLRQQATPVADKTRAANGSR